MPRTFQSIFMCLKYRSRPSLEGACSSLNLNLTRFQDSARMQAVHRERGGKKKEGLIDARWLSKREQKCDVGRIRTYAPEGTRFLVLRDNHSATTPKITCWLVLVT